jgi:hypothetical protein
MTTSAVPNSSTSDTIPEADLKRSHHRSLGRSVGRMDAQRKGPSRGVPPRRWLVGSGPRGVSVLILIRQLNPCGSRSVGSCVRRSVNVFRGQSLEQRRLVIERAVNAKNNARQHNTPTPPRAAAPQRAKLLLSAIQTLPTAIGRHMKYGINGQRPTWRSFAVDDGEGARVEVDRSPGDAIVSTVARRRLDHTLSVNSLGDRQSIRPSVRHANAGAILRQALTPRRQSIQSSPVDYPVSY